MPPLQDRENLCRGAAEDAATPSYCLRLPKCEREWGIVFLFLFWEECCGCVSSLLILVFLLVEQACAPCRDGAGG